MKISKLKNIFAKDCTLNWSEEVFVTKEVKNTVPWTYIIDLNWKENIGTFSEKELQKSKSNRVDYNNSINIWTDKKRYSIKTGPYFPEPYERYSGNVKVELDLSKYGRKGDLKGPAEVVASNLAAKSDLVSLKAEVDKIDIDKLTTVPADLSQLSNAVDNNVVKKVVYDKLVTKVNAIDSSRLF